MEGPELLTDPACRGAGNQELRKDPLEAEMAKLSRDNPLYTQEKHEHVLSQQDTMSRCMKMRLMSLTTPVDSGHTRHLDAAGGAAIRKGSSRACSLEPEKDSRRRGEAAVRSHLLPALSAEGARERAVRAAVPAEHRRC